MKVFTGADSVPIKAWVDGVTLDDNAKQQLFNVASMPFIHSHVAAMPDVHWGMGATVGSVIATKGAIIPAAVGVDIGCGMMAVKTTLKAKDLPDNLAAIRYAIEAAVPHGRTDNGGANDRGAWGNVPSNVQGCMRLLVADPCYERVTTNYPDLVRHSTQAAKQLGTLGTGNHFIELCLDKEQNVWIMLHSGSRGIGNRIGSFFIEKAKEEMERWYISLPDKDLSYLVEGSKYFDDYWMALSWAQNYARKNRETMMNSVCSVLSKMLTGFALTEEAINCHHNYVSKEKHYGSQVFLTRKGAVSARKDELGIIPGSMGARSFIVRGLGNRESFCSCSHGAGRVMSRGEARKQISLEEHAEATRGVECRKDDEVLDESPRAYKDIQAVMDAQKDLVEIVYELKQVLCIKG